MKSYLINIYSISDFDKFTQRLICNKIRKQWGIIEHDINLIKDIKKKKLLFNEKGDLIENLIINSCLLNKNNLETYQIVNKDGKFSDGYINKNSFTSNRAEKKWYSKDSIKKFFKSQNLDNTYRVLVMKYKRIDTELKEINKL